MKSVLRACVATSMLVLAGSLPARAAPSIETICADAAKEPPLTWYTSQDPTRNDAALAAFKQHYPNISVEALRLVTGRLAARYGAERSAGVINAGLISLADPLFVDDGAKKGWFEDFPKSDLPALQALDDKWFDHGAATTSITVLGIAYNKARVGNDPPKTWKDLVNPKYRGQIIFGDPKSVPSYLALARIWRDELGDDFLKNLAKQDLTLVPSVVPPTQQLAAGEVTIVAPNVAAVVDPLVAQGAPIGFVIPEFTTGNEFQTVLSKGSKNPNGARCLYNFLFTPEGQRAYNGASAVSPIGPAGGDYPMPPRYVMPRLKELPAHEKTLLGLMGMQ